MAADSMDSLAAVFGKGGGKKSPLPEPDGDEAAPAADAGSDEPSEEFRTAITETGLGLEDDQLGALWRAIKACAGSY